MNTELTKSAVALAPASAETLAKIEKAEELIRKQPQIEPQMEHVLHAGMYSRTCRLDARVVIVGVTIKVPTQIIIHGDCLVLAGDEWQALRGFNVIPGQAGRKGVFVTGTATEITMIFPTAAKTVEEAEREFTDETEMLLSRRQDGNNDIVTITGS